MGDSIQAEKIKAAIGMMKALADTIRQLGQIPSGHLYAQVMGVMGLDEYDWIIDRLVGSGLVRKDASHLLTWTGPNFGQKHGPTG